MNAGSEYTLACIALKTASGLTQSAQVLWTRPDGAPVVSTLLSDVVSESLRTVQNVTFSSLSTSDAGVYRCASILSSPALSIPYQIIESHAVTVLGMYFIFY